MYLGGWILVLPKAAVEMRMAGSRRRYRMPGKSHGWEIVSALPYASRKSTFNNLAGCVATYDADYGSTTDADRGRLTRQYLATHWPD
ncbi:hypothetical protein BANRA_00067 [Escherichia coli]|nr:hypothetical protein BANRA_00067 [Escherichia coli]